MLGYVIKTPVYLVLPPVYSTDSNALWEFLTIVVVVSCIVSVHKLSSVLGCFVRASAVLIGSCCNCSDHISLVFLVSHLPRPYWLVLWFSWSCLIVFFRVSDGQLYFSYVLFFPLQYSRLVIVLLVSTQIRDRPLGCIKVIIAVLLLGRMFLCCSSLWTIYLLPLS